MTFAPAIKARKSALSPMRDFASQPALCRPSERRVATEFLRRSGVGNQAMLRRLEAEHESRANSELPPTLVGLQAKLAVGDVDDPLEHEADRVADQMMRMPDPSRVAHGSSPVISRQCDACDEEDAPKVRTKPAGAPTAQGEAPAAVHDVLSTPGQPLSDATRAFFEPRFGQDFSDVRVHADSAAADSARAIGALGYTVGRHIVFADGCFAPNVDDGRRLIAHELTHTLQQTRSPASAALHDLPVSRPNDQAVFEEESVAERFSQGPIQTGGLQRQAVVACANLESARFSPSAKLQRCFDDADRLREGDPDSDAVMRIQQALIDVQGLKPGQAYDLGSTGPTGNGVDGKYGPKTAAAVMKFKADEQLGSTQFGDVGPGVMHRLDILFSSTTTPMGEPPTSEQGQDPKGSYPGPLESGNGIIYFDYNKADLSPSAEKEITRYAGAYKGLTVQLPTINIAAYASREGQEKYNFNLSQRRGEAVRDKLNALGLVGPLPAITVSPFGATSEFSKDDLRPNRRAELPLLPEAKSQPPEVPPRLEVPPQPPAPTCTKAAGLASATWSIAGRTAISASMNEGPGVTRVTFDLFDLSHGCKYSLHFAGVGIAVGESGKTKIGEKLSHFTFSGPSNGVSFTTSVPVKASDFEGIGRIEIADAGIGIVGYGFMLISLHRSDTSPQPINSKGWEFAVGVSIGAYGGKYYVFDADD